MSAESFDEPDEPYDEEPEDDEHDLDPAERQPFDFDARYGLRPLAPRWQALEAALDELGGSRFAVSGHAPCPPPEIRVDGRALMFPLSATDRAVLLAACTRSGFGDGARTVFDPEVRSAWELDPDRLAISGLAQVLEHALAETARALGEGPLVAELYKLLHYEPGDHFEPHRDGVKLPGMIATLVIGLPGEHVGGDLRVSVLGDEVDLRLASTAERAEFLAFYADCRHALTPIEGGSRTCLSFSVRRAGPATSPPTDSAPPALVQALGEWLADPSQPDALVVPLAHVYPGEVPALVDLRGDDRSLVRALLAAADDAGCPASLAALELLQEGSDEEQWTLTVGVEGTTEVLPTECLARPFVLAFLPRAGGSWWTGNEGDDYRYRYRHAAVVVRRPAPASARRVRDRVEERALVGLLARARDRRWRRLDLTWLGDHARLGHDAFRGLGALAGHLEELATPVFGGLVDAWRLERLRVLAVHGRYIPDLSPALTARLHALELHGAELSGSALAALGEATELRRLLARERFNKRLPDGLARAPLRSLRLPSTSISELPPWLGADGRLEELDLRHCGEVRDIPSAVLGPALRVLHLGGTAVSHLDLARATGLQRLELAYCPLRELPRLAGGARLESLALAAYREPPPWLPDLAVLAALPALRSLSLTGLGLRELPALPEPPLLERLRVDFNPLAALPAQVGRMTRLRELHAGSNGLRSVPDLSALTRLCVLDLSFNELARLDGLADTPALEQLLLNCCGPLELPAHVASARLRVVSLCGVPLAALPAWLCDQQGLEELTLADTGLPALQLSPDTWPALHDLRIAGEALHDVPPADRLPALRRLELGDPPTRTPANAAAVAALRARGVYVEWRAEPDPDVEAYPTAVDTSDDDLPF